MTLHLHASPPRSSFNPTSARSALLRGAWMLAAGVLAAAAPRAAVAAEASCDLDCDPGYVCELLPQACPLILCVDENAPDCPRCDGAPAPACVPAACESDADCGGGTVCAEHTVYDCPAPVVPTDPGSERKAAADRYTNGCTPSEIKQCTPRWQLPCEIDDDCGAGFRCEEQQRCSVPAVPADPEARERAAAADVSCEPSGVFACVVVETPCTTDAECPAQFVCAESPSRACAADSTGAGDCDGSGEPKLCSPVVTAVGGVVNDGVLTSAPGSGVLPEPAESASASSSAGGCAMSDPARSASSPALLGALGLAAVFAVRRRRATSAG